MRIVQRYRFQGKTLLRICLHSPRTIGKAAAKRRYVTVMFRESFGYQTGTVESYCPGMYWFVAKDGSYSRVFRKKDVLGWYFEISDSVLKAIHSINLNIK